MSARRLLPFALSLLLASPAWPADRGPAPALRGEQAAESPAAAPRPPTTAERTTGLKPPDWSTSPRIGGFGGRTGGAACRSACAQSLYLCRSGQDEDQCSPTWSRCVAACPEESPDPL